MTINQFIIFRTIIIYIGIENIANIEIHTVRCFGEYFENKYYVEYWYWYEISIDVLLLLLKDIGSFKQCKVIGIRLGNDKPSGLFYVWHAKSDMFEDKCKEQDMEINSLHHLVVLI